MLIAIAKEGNQVSRHFGHCEGFELVDIKDGKVAGRETVPNPGHRPGFLPVFLAQKGVKVIISGGMGGSAQDLCPKRYRGLHRCPGDHNGYY